MELIMNEQYKTLSSNSKILYSLFLNRTNYSKKNLKKFSDKNGIFIYYSNSQIQNHLYCSVHTAVNLLNELEQAGLIRKEYQKRGLPLKIYVNDIRGENTSTYSGSKKPQDKFPYKPYSYSNYKEKPATNHFEGNGWKGNADGEKPLTQAQINRRTFGDKKNNRHSHKENSNSASQEKEVSFDVDLEEKFAKVGLVHFSRKKQKRRTRNAGPTL